MKNSKAITLIALIITIIVLLILAGVTINMVMGDNGLINKSKTSVAKYENAQAKENSALAGYEAEIDNARDTVTIPKEEYNRLKNLSNYSTDEQIVGTWINGKPIYEKTVVLSENVLAKDNTRCYLITDITNIDSLIDIKAYISEFKGIISGDWVGIDSTGVFLYIYDNGGSKGNLAPISAYTYQYTKTTDTATI